MKLVTAPVPRPLAKRRQTTKKAWSTIGSAAARASSREAGADVERDAAAPVGAQEQAGERHEQRHEPVHERPPSAGDDPVLADAPEDHRETDDAAERVAGGGRAVAVEGGERARREARRRGARQPPERGRRARPPPSRGALSGSPPASCAAAQPLASRPSRSAGTATSPRASRVGREDAAEASLRPGRARGSAGRRPGRAGGEDEHEEDAVGGEEAVRLDAAPELARDHDPRRPPKGR